MSSCYVTMRALLEYQQCANVGEISVGNSDFVHSTAPNVNMTAL